MSHHSSSLLSISPIKRYANNQTHNNTEQSPNISSATVKKEAYNYTQQSPNRHTQDAEIELWRSRCNKLEASLCQANTDLELSNYKSRKNKDIEQKIEGLVMQNAQLTNDIQNINKSFNQKKTESDIWKSKYETQMNQVISLKANYEMEIRRLQNEMNKLKKNNIVTQSNNNASCAGGCNCNQQSFKNSCLIIQEQHKELNQRRIDNQEELQLYEQQLQNQRNIIEEREKEIQMLQSKIQQQKRQFEVDFCRTLEEKEQYRKKISDIELEFKHKVEFIQDQLEEQYKQGFENMKKMHINELEVQTNEIAKLKTIVNLKTKEIEQILEQNKLLKLNFEKDSNIIREENASLKQKIVEIEFNKEQDINMIKQVFADQHDNDIQGLQFHHKNQLDAANLQIDQLKGIIINKSEEIDQQIREKLQQRENYNNEELRLKQEISLWQDKWNKVEQEKKYQCSEAQQVLEQTNKAHEEAINEQQNQLRFLESEIENFKTHLNHKNQELDNKTIQFNTIKIALEEDLKKSQMEIEIQDQKLQNLEIEKHIMGEDFKQKVNLLEAQASERNAKYEKELAFLDQELRNSRDAFKNKNSEASSLQTSLTIKQVESRKLRADIDNFQQQIQFLENQIAQQSIDLKAQFDANLTNQVQELREGHQKQLETLLKEVSQLKSIIDLRNLEFNELVDKYQKLELSLEEFKVNAEKLKDYEKRISLLSAEIVTTKNLYDVFAKTKARFTTPKK